MNLTDPPGLFSEPQKQQIITTWRNTGAVVGAFIGSLIGGGGGSLTGPAAAGAVPAGAYAGAAGGSVVGGITAEILAKGVLHIATVMQNSGGSSDSDSCSDDDDKKLNLEKINDNYLKKKGIDSHELKRDYLGQKAKISHYDLYQDKNTAQIYILEKGGKGMPIETNIYQVRIFVVSNHLTVT